MDYDTPQAKIKCICAIINTLCMYHLNLPLCVLMLHYTRNSSGSFMFNKKKMVKLKIRKLT